MACSTEMLGVYRMALYINKDLTYNFPDISKPREINLIAHGSGSYVVENNDLPKWQRTVNYSQNYKQNYFDKFSFYLRGIENNVPEMIKNLRNNRLGYIVEIITLNNKSFVFPMPVFLSQENTKQVDENKWFIELSYRTETFKDYYIKLNTLLMTYSFVITGENTILSGENNGVITGN